MQRITVTSDDDRDYLPPRKAGQGKKIKRIYAKRERGQVKAELRDSRRAAL